MATNIFDLDSSTVALTAATAKSVLGVKAATNVALRVLDFSITHDGATSTNAASVVEVMRSTFATSGPGTNSTSITPAKREPGRAETIQATAAKTWSTEPTVLTAQRTFNLPNYNGQMAWIYPFTAPIIIIGGQGLVIRATSPANVNIVSGLSCEE